MEAPDSLPQKGPILRSVCPVVRIQDLGLSTRIMLIIRSSILSIIVTVVATRVPVFAFFKVQSMLSTCAKRAYIPRTYFVGGLRPLNNPRSSQRKHLRPYMFGF